MLGFDVASTRLTTAMIASLVAGDVSLKTGAWYGNPTREEGNS